VVEEGEEGEEGEEEGGRRGGVSVDVPTATLPNHLHW